MAHEELYIIVEGARRKLDLLSPSGITLNYVSNLFNDLDKINASYSYTFKLPRTANNVRILELVDDVRADGKFTRIKNATEFVYDGVSLFTEANLYVSDVNKEEISAVLTWDLNRGLQELKDHDMSLNELGNHLPEGEEDYVGDEESDYEKDKVVLAPGWENSQLTFHKMSEYDPTQPSFRSLHNAGIFPYFYAQATEGQHTDPPSDINTTFHDFEQFPAEHSLWEEDGHLNRNLPFIRANEKREYTKSTDYLPSLPDDSPEYNFKTYAFPTPIIPVPYLVGVIGRIYNLKFDFSGEKYNKLCVPLIENKVSDGLARLNYIRLIPTRGRALGYIDVAPAAVFNYPNINPVVIGGITARIHTTALGDWSSYYFDTFKSNFYESKFMISGNLTIEVESPQASHNYPRFYMDGYPKIILYNESYKDDDFFSVGELPCRSISYRKVDGVEYTRLSFNFNPSDGWDVFTSEPICRSSFAMRLVYGKEELRSFTIHESYGALRLHIVPTNYAFGCYVNLFKNLPDISCMDFIKSVCYALGGYPYQTADGTIKLKEYKNIAERILAGDVNNWSAKTLKALGNNSEELNFDANNVTSLSLAKKNYFLMKNDKVDEFGEEEQNDPLEDAYEHGYERIDIDSDLLPDIQTLFTHPFNGGFLWEKGGYGRRMFFSQSNMWDASIAPNVPKGGDRWKLNNDENDPSVNGAWQILFACSEMKPVMGVVTPLSVPVAEVTNNTATEYDPVSGGDVPIYQVLTIHYTGEYTDYLSMRPWNCATDTPKVNGHDLLQALFGNPCLVKEDMLLNVKDLAFLDIEKPVFLEKYNSYFAIKNIEVGTDGTSKVELIRIPTEILVSPVSQQANETPSDNNENNDNNGGEDFEEVPVEW